MTPPSKSDPIIIVGAGAFGLSTALHLAQAGYRDVTVFDKGAEIPSPFSAANDLNKILRAEYEDEFYTNLAVEALKAWKTPLFAPHYHQTGFLHCVSGEAPQKAIDTLDRFRAAAERHPEVSQHVVPIDGREDVVRAAWQLQDGPLPGWKGYLNRFDGYAHSSNALKAVHVACVALGVRFLLGEAGDVAEIVYEPATAATAMQDPQKKKGERRATGVRNRRGATYHADTVVVAVGAAAAGLVPSLGTQIVAKSWSVAHVQLTGEEASALRGIPVTYARDLGFLFEPEPGSGLLKVCPMGGGYVNTDARTGVSAPPTTTTESRLGFMPAADEARARRLLAQTFPALAARPFVGAALCWFADADGSDFVVDFVPGAPNVLLLSGDSGHGFKMFPLVGGWARDLLEHPAQRQENPLWRWKEPATATSAAASWGADVSWRLGSAEEFRDIRPSPPKAKL
ncbi:putative FAD dependent oxidoreductase [Rosellinia necatrix]|uniref:Putative FAD dependent oxidoreductase n=1 Tax=Rosellinia necatrix TaxID=77044 RepID=A0A1W2TAF2_ROSNE|nr:putative FAD dependent oxidoreductase [Rosellinia necatrix]